MEKPFKRLAALVLTVLMVFSLFPVSNVGAVTYYTDVPSDYWGYPAIMEWSNGSYAILEGYGNGKFGPEDAIRDLDLTLILDRILGIPQPAWRDSVSLTREQAVVKIAEALKIVPVSNPSASQLFTDDSQISAQYKPLIYGMVARGYVHGVGDGRFSPKTNFTRAQILQIAYNAISAISDSSETGGNYLEDYVIRSSGATIKNTIVGADLIVGQGVGTGSTTLSRVTVRGRLLILGGGTINIRDTSNISEIYVYNTDNPVNIVFDQDSYNNSMVYVEEGANVTINGYFGGATIVGPNATLTIDDATADSVYINPEATNSRLIVGCSSTAHTTTLTTITVDAARSTVTVNPCATVNTIYVNADNVKILGDGTVKKVIVGPDVKTGPLVDTPNTEVDNTKGKGTVTDEDGNTVAEPGEIGNTGNTSSIKYTIRLDFNTGINPQEFQYSDGDAINDVVGEYPTYAGYRFGGWYDYDNALGVTSPQGTKINKLTKSDNGATLYAYWISNSPTDNYVVFHYNDYNHSYFTAYYTYSATIGQLFDGAPSATFYKNANGVTYASLGLQFAGWRDENGVICGTNYSVTGGVLHLYAEWNETGLPDNEFNITFRVTGYADVKTTFAIGQKISEVYGPTPPPPADMTFAYWTNLDTGLSYAHGSSMPYSLKDQVLVAQFVTKSDGTNNRITYELHTNSYYSESIYVIGTPTYNYLGLIQLDPAAFRMPNSTLTYGEAGYKFDGWYNVSGTKYETTTDTAYREYYAHWVLNGTVASTPTPTVTASPTATPYQIYYAQDIETAIAAKAYNMEVVGFSNELYIPDTASITIPTGYTLNLPANKVIHVAGSFFVAGTVTGAGTIQGNCSVNSSTHSSTAGQFKYYESANINSTIVKPGATAPEKLYTWSFTTNKWELTALQPTILKLYVNNTEVTLSNLDSSQKLTISDSIYSKTSNVVFRVEVSNPNDGGVLTIAWESSYADTFPTDNNTLTGTGDTYTLTPLSGSLRYVRCKIINTNGTSTATFYSPIMVIQF